ncbi:MAG: DNA mismatch repair protein MutS [Christensenellales bacterium]|jgi:DNA mismatch repair protein MutS
MAISPMMQHYLQTKEKYQDAVLFYRLGDFYEFFYEDAILMSKVLDLTLTGKDCGLEERAPMCGIPYHAAEGYIEKLVKLGYKVAICEQLTAPQKGVKIVERDVVRIVTSGTLVEENMLDQNKNNYIVCIYKNKENLGISYCEISKGEFKVFELNISNSLEKLNDFLSQLAPSEIICNSEAKQLESTLQVCLLGLTPRFYTYFDWAFDATQAENANKMQFGNNYKRVFELDKQKFAVVSSGALLQYLFETQKTTLHHLNKIAKHQFDKNMIIDVNTKRNLEILESLKDKRKKGTLLWLLDQTKTSMGARLFRDWISAPLYDEKEINLRLDAVQELVSKLILRESLTQELAQLKDIERIIGRIATSGLHPKHCLALASSLSKVPLIKKITSSFKTDKLTSLSNGILDFSEITTLLNNAISPDAPANMKDGGYIREGYNKELDALRNVATQGVNWVNELEMQERERTGIKNLKISYNKVHGYFIEVNKSQTAFVPLNYERRQTIANNERYITEELKEIENKILNSNELSIKLEQEIFAFIRQELIKEIPKLQILGQILSEIDCLTALAITAVKNNYIRPKVSKKLDCIKIIEGRHPVVEAFLKENLFIPNDTYLNTTTDKTMIITGPNMAGKSTYMRQVALITYMAHIGSFVPAKEAEIALTDRIFTRVGASDDLAFGQSTFMVEMSEVANILHNATNNSLIILDEIGRGTSTFDGLSIAWSVVEYLSQNMSAKTLFATHYHELTELEGLLDGVKNYKILLKEVGNEIVFLRKIVRGGANKSFGIEVASLAGLPKNVISRAKEISNILEKSNLEHKISITHLENNPVLEEKQNNSREIISILSDIKIETISPLTAFDILNDLVQKLKK